jgi:hypothetical protein
VQSLSDGAHKIANDGRKIKEHIKDMLVQCSKTRDIDATSVVLVLDNKSLEKMSIGCGGAKETTKAGPFMSFKNIYEEITPIPLSKGSPILSYTLPDKQMAVFLPEGYKMENGKVVSKGKIAVNLLPEK